MISVSIPASINSIVEYTFNDCDRLTSVVVPDGVTSINAKTFAYCDRLVSVTIPDSVTSTGDEAFARCPVLTTIKVPAIIKPFGEEITRECTLLASVYYGAERIISANSNIFSEETYERATLDVTEDNNIHCGTLSPWWNIMNVQAHEFPAGMHELTVNSLYHARYLTFHA